VDLNSIAAPIIDAVNARIPVGVQISVGIGSTAADGKPIPAYATPGSITASIGGTFTCTSTGTTLTVGTVLTGSLQPGDDVSGGDGTNALPTGTAIVSQLTGTPGGAGTYQMSAAAAPADLGSCTVTSLSTVLNVTAVSSGVLQAGHALADVTSALLFGTAITELLSGTGAVGTYEINQPQTVSSEAMTTSMTLSGQVQPISTRDLQMLDGINLGGVRWKIYLEGEVDSIVRPEKKGGDLITISTGRHQGTWLVVAVLEQWPDWCVCAMVQQLNG
jgi:hypothetical protein